MIAGVDTDWQSEAECQNWSPQLFFYEEGSRIEPWRRVLPSIICGKCPVTRECLTYALGFESKAVLPFGIWGGTTPAMRHAKEFKHVKLLSNGRCTKGVKCPGCRPIADWVDLLMAAQDANEEVDADAS